MEDIGAAQKLTVLIVGNVRAWRSDGRDLPADSQFTYADLDDLTMEFIESVRPDVILSSVFTPEFDALDVAQMLSNIGFQGRYRAFAPSLPNPEIVRREIQSHCPFLDFDLLLIDQVRNLRPH